MKIDSTTEINFEKDITIADARVYLEATLRDASKMKISITWKFDEQQAESFHKEWTGHKFLRCVEKLVEKGG